MFLAPRLLYSYIQIRGLIFNASRLLRGIAHSKPREGMKEQGINYKEWEPEKLIERVTLLEKQLRELSEKSHSQSSVATPSPQATRLRRTFDPSKYSTRFIALKFAYLGQRYNGFEHHANNTTPLPTIEEMLWKALDKARLIVPTENLNTTGDVNWEGCDYSKCGRTDRGVSAFGQVISLRVRSNRPLARHAQQDSSLDEGKCPFSEIEPAVTPLQQILQQPNSDNDASEEPISFDPVKDEIPYVQVLNRVLPPDIRILAWCPTPPPNFSSRFSCRERRYRYFFTQPAFMPTPGGSNVRSDVDHNRSSDSYRRDGWLNIDAMNEAATKFEGLHDFRNFCKIDASKQIESFQRRIFQSKIVEIDQTSEQAASVNRPAFLGLHSSPTTNGLFDRQEQNPTLGTPKVYAFVLHGSAFLWHQVRHMVAILFLIGQGFESPDLITTMLDINANPAKPMYEMAEDAPLVLWDCIFPLEGGDSHEDAMEWIYVGDTACGVAGNTKVSRPVPKGGKYGTGGLAEDLWKVWRQRKMDELLAGTLLNEVLAQGSVDEHTQAAEQNAQGPRSASEKVFCGGDEARLKGKYIPVLERPRMESVGTINARYAAKKGFEKRDEVRDTGFRAVVLERRGDHVE